MRTNITVRAAQLADLEPLTRLCVSLWPHHTPEELQPDIIAALSGKPNSTLPVVYFVAEKRDGNVVAFINAGLRSHANGCDPSRPVGFIEGWYVDEDYRQKGVGGMLIEAAENWARALGCTEMASDALIDNELSERAHIALGYEAYERCLDFRKTL